MVWKLDMFVIVSIPICRGHGRFLFISKILALLVQKDILFLPSVQYLTDCWG